MALGGALRQISGSSVFLPESKLSCCRLLFFDPPKSIRRRRRRCWIPPRSIHDHAAAIASSSSSSSISRLPPGYPSGFHIDLPLHEVLTTPPVVKDGAREDEEGILTELRRSLLESQWASTGDNCDRDMVFLKMPQRRSLSARQRRILSKRSRKANRLPTVLDHKDSARGVGMETIMRDPVSETVRTLGYKRGSKRELLTKEQEILLSKKMKVGQNLRNAQEKLTVLLGQEPSNELWATSVKLSFPEVQSKLLEADGAREQIFLCNLRLVVSIARKYSAFGVNLPDLIQEGAIGLLRGLEKYDYKKGFKLSTYVHWWIRQSVTQALAQHSKTVRIPSYMYGKLMILNKTIEELRVQGKPVSVKILADILKMPEEMVSVVLKATKKMTSLDTPKRWSNINSIEDSLHNYVGDPSHENNPWHEVDEMYLREDLDALLSWALPEREKEIIRMYYGLHCPKGQGLSFEKIGQRIGISRERVRQLEACALRKLVVASREIGMGSPLAH